MPWIKHELEEKGFFVIALSMPDPLNPQADAWVKKIYEEVGSPDEDTYLIGHSLGCAAILRYLETIHTQVGGAVLVAGPSDNMKLSFIKSFFEKEFDFEKIKHNCRKFVVIHSDNDRIVPINHAYALKEKLNAKLILEHKGHFTSMEGVKELPSLLEALLSID